MTILQDRQLRTRQMPSEYRAALKQRTSYLKQRARPGVSEIRDNVFTICGFSCGAAAGFYHSVFTGLIVSAILFLAYEWKTSE